MEDIVEYLRKKDKRLCYITRNSAGKILKYAGNDVCMYIHNLDADEVEVKRVIDKTKVSPTEFMIEEKSLF